jgi:hypothetical protein
MMAGVHFPKENGRQQAQADGTDEWVDLQNRNPPAVRAENGHSQRFAGAQLSAVILP